MQAKPQVHPEPSTELGQALARLGYAEFRPGQKEAVTTLLEEKKLLLVAPTGGGKSLCYQLPALLLPGITLVVSPLIALMHDQVEALGRRQIPATFLASTLEGDEIRRRMGKIRAGAYKLVYAAPERLVLDGFRGLLLEAGLSLIAVDEAHCISEWGHDFRPEYMKIGELTQSLPDVRVLACTATATPVVRDEILSRLGLPEKTPQLVRGFARPNLALSVLDVAGGRQKEARVDQILASSLGSPNQASGSAIVYAGTRKATEQETARLRALGWRALGYHAGMAGPERERTLASFVAGDTKVVVATNAFGMGIDRSDVRAVIHLAPPGSIEAYYQEVGRAGRDGEPAVGLLLTSASDLPLRRGLLTRPSPEGQLPDSAIVEHKWSLFLELMRWAEGGSCRHDAILRYFGDEDELLSGCGRCDVCGALSQPSAKTSPEAIQILVRKALSAVARVHGRFGLTAAVQLLRGASDARLSRLGLDRTKTFGILKDRSESWLLALLRRCATAGWVDFLGHERPVVILTQRGAAVMRAEIMPRILLPEEAPAKFVGGGRTRSALSASALHEPLARLDEREERVFAALRAVRLKLSQQAQVPPYVVASDRTLRDLAQLRPVNLDQLKLAHGMGPAKAERFGRALLGAVAASC